MFLIFSFVVAAAGTSNVWRTTVQEVSVPESLAEPVYVSYLHTSTLMPDSTEVFGIRLSKIEELSQSSSVTRTYAIEDLLLDSCESTAFTDSTINSLSTKELQGTIDLQDRATLPRNCQLKANSTLTSCSEPIEFLDTTVSRQVSAYQVAEYWQSQQLCFPDRDSSTTQSPAFNNTVHLSYNISDWYFCDLSCTDSQAGNYLRLTFEIDYPASGDEVEASVNDTAFTMSDHVPRCQTQYSRWSPNYGTGSYCSVELAEQQEFLSDAELGRVCHNSTYLGDHGLGDDFKELALSSGGNRVRLRFSEHVQHSTGMTKLEGAGMQGPVYGNNKVTVVLPKDSQLQYDILIDMNRNAATVPHLNVWLVLVLLIGLKY